MLYTLVNLKIILLFHAEHKYNNPMKMWKRYCKFIFHLFSWSPLSFSPLNDFAFDAYARSDLLCYAHAYFQVCLWFSISIHSIEIKSSPRAWPVTSSKRSQLYPADRALSQRCQPMRAH